MDKEAQERLYKLLGEKVREYRTQAKLTQDQLATKVELTRTSVAKVEKGKQHSPLHLLITIAKVLGTTLNDLIPEEADYDPMIQIDKKMHKEIKEEDKNKFDVFFKDFLKHQ